MRIARAVALAVLVASAALGVPWMVLAFAGLLPTWALILWLAVCVTAYVFYIGTRNEEAER